MVQGLLRGLSCSAACGILFPNQGLNLHPLYCKADSLPLDHQGSPLDLRKQNDSCRLKQFAKPDATLKRKSAVFPITLGCPLACGPFARGGLFCVFLLLGLYVSCFAHSGLRERRKVTLNQAGQAEGGAPGTEQVCRNSCSAEGVAGGWDSWAQQC